MTNINARVRLILAAAGAALLLGGCAMNRYLPVDAAGNTTATPPANAPAAPPAQSPPPATPTPQQARPVPGDTCGAQGFAYIVGRPKVEIPVPVDPSKRRVVCSTCAITQDFRPDRLTITFDQTTALVTGVRCG